MKKLLPMLLLACVARPLFASCAVERFTITPPRPTVSDDIRLVLAGGCSDGCIVHSPRVTVADGTITVDLERYDGCILVPQPWGERVDIGRVPAGTYALVVKTGTTDLLRQTLVVRNPPLTLRPSFGTPGTQVVIDSRDPGICPGSPCPNLPAVFFGGVRATSVDVTEGGDLVAVAPPHAPGLVDVTVGLTGSDQTITAPEAFLYPDPQADLTAEHERLLFPVAFEGPGAHGSLWTTENVVMTTTAVAVSTIPLLPASRIMLRNTNRDGGLFLLVPRGTESRLAYSSHIVDRSRRTTDAGTEMRVVHEDETGPLLHILNVPITAEARQTLRIYDFDAIPGREVSVDINIGGRRIGMNATLQHRIICVTTPCYPEHPTYAVVNLENIGQLRGAATADIRIRARTGDAPLWAFVSVTNNDTQHVTTYTPQHRPAGSVRVP